MNNTQGLYLKAKKLIPGGTQLLSKRPEMFLPNHWPAYYKKAESCYVWDLDDNKYIDTVTMGIGSCILGFADPDVNKVVKKVIDEGSMSTLNPPEEVELAERLCDLHPWAEKVRFARTGGEAMSVAVRIARAASGKDRILFSGYHGWHDWYISANISDEKALGEHLLSGLEPAGVPRVLKDSAIPFKFNDIEKFKELINKYNDIGVIVLETIRNDPPNETFIKTIRKLTKERGIVFIVDEITSGWRLNLGGAHLTFDIEPDMAIFAKGMSNGYPMSAIIGKKEIMDAAQNSFISSTYWTERIGPAAALETIKKMESLNVQQHLVSIGKTIQNGWIEKAQTAGLKVKTSGIYPLSHFSFLDFNPLVMKTLFTQEMLKKGYLASTGLYTTWAHTEEVVDDYLQTCEEVFHTMKDLCSDGTPEKHLLSDVCHSGFERLN